MVLTMHETRKLSKGRHKFVDNYFKEKNKDEAGKSARRESSDSDQTHQTRLNSLRPSVPFNLTSNQLQSEISECIKLNTENKINEKNAFQLKFIDYLDYALEKHDPIMNNLQIATASLEVSTKIYSCRVDKVHADLLKIIQVRLDRVLENEKESCPKKKQKNQQIISLSIDKLKGIIETYDSTAFVKCPRDILSSDMLIQVYLHQYTNQGVLLNYHNHVILDSVENVSNKCKFLVTTIDDFQNQEICPSYASFNFNSSASSSDEEIEEISRMTNHMEESTNFHFAASVLDNDDDCNQNIFTDSCEGYEERFNQEQQNSEISINSQDIHNSPNSSFEYSSHQTHDSNNHQLSTTQTVETCKLKKKKKENIWEISKNDSKREAKTKFGSNEENTQISEKNETEDKLSLCPRIILYKVELHTFYNKSPECLRTCGDREENKQVEVENCTSQNVDKNNSDSIDFGNEEENCTSQNVDKNNSTSIGNEDDNCDNNYYFEDNINQSISSDNATPTQVSAIPQYQQAFVGDNLVSFPKTINKIFVPYSQKVKKINMHHLKKVMWRNLTESFTVNEISCDNKKTLEANNKINLKLFSNVYKEIPQELSKPYAESLSPGIAFIALLQLGHEKNLKIDQTEDLSDTGISNSSQ